MSLKAKIRNIAKQKNIPTQVILQNYMFERLLVRLAASTYKDKFVLKGGMLVAAIVGLDNRATMDLDTTLKNLPLTPEAIRSALEQVAAVPFDDGVTFEVGKISPIREDDIYGGYRGFCFPGQGGNLVSVLCSWEKTRRAKAPAHPQSTETPEKLSSAPLAFRAFPRQPAICGPKGRVSRPAARKRGRSAKGHRRPPSHRNARKS